MADVRGLIATSDKSSSPTLYGVSRAYYSTGRVCNLHPGYVSHETLEEKIMENNDIYGVKSEIVIHDVDGEPMHCRRIEFSDESWEIWLNNELVDAGKPEGKEAA